MYWLFKLLLMLLPPLLVLFLCITVNRKLLQQVTGHQKKVKWQTTSVNVNTLLLEASVSNYFWWYLVKTELSPVSQRLPAPHSHRADAAKCLLLVSVMTLAPVWITWPGGWLASLQGASVTTPDSQRTTTADAHTHSYNHTHNSFSWPSLFNSKSSAGSADAGPALLWPPEGRRTVSPGQQLLLPYQRWYTGNNRRAWWAWERSARETVHHNLSSNSLNLVLRWRV